MVLVAYTYIVLLERDVARHLSNVASWLSALAGGWYHNQQLWHLNSKTWQSSKQQTRHGQETYSVIRTYYAAGVMQAVLCTILVR